MNPIASARESPHQAGLSLKQAHVRWLIALAVACGAIVVFFPFFWMAVTSLKTAPEIQRVPLQVAPDHWLNFSNYVEVFRREPFMNFIYETLEWLCDEHTREIERAAGELHAKLHYGRTEDIIELGLHEYLMDFLERISKLGDEISRHFLVPE